MVCQLAGLSLFLFAAPYARAQQPDGAEEIPLGALLKPAPDLAKWTVTYEYPNVGTPQVPARNGSEVAQITTIKTGNIVSQDVVDGRGSHEQIWYVGGDKQYRKPAGKSEWFESSPSMGGNKVNSDFVALPENGYRGWDWIDRDSYLGMAKLEFGNCLVFVPGGRSQSKISGKSLSKDQVAAFPIVALVNAETRFPVALRSGGVTQRFEFGQAPTAMQQFPADLKDSIKNGEEARKRLYQPAPRPY